MLGRDLDPAPFVGRRVLDERDQPVGHEATRTDDLAGPRDLANLDHTARRHDLDAPAGPARLDLERLHALAGIDEGFDAIAFHTPTIERRAPIGSTIVA